jgi:cell division septation protein DedD
MFKIRSKNRGQAKIYKIELTPISALFWCIFLFFSLIWIFVLGILVGRGFFPGSLTTISDLRGQIKNLQDIISHKETYDSRASKEMDNDPKLAFYDKLTSKKDEIKNNWNPETKVDSSTSGKEKSSLENESDKKPLTDENVLIKALEKKEESKASISQDMYTVQIASIGDKEKAEKMIKDLNDQGYDAYFYETDVKGNRYYRIRCGRFSNREEALNYSQRLEKEAGLKGFVSRIE